MRIMLTNDDGINAPGLVALHDELRKLGEVHVIAPWTAQSATSHGITFHEPLQVREHSVTGRVKGLAVDGRPADCVKLALTTLWPARIGGVGPDLVVSGMNAGTNVGIHIIYSGTVGAAIEAAFLGVPSIAVSLHFNEWSKVQWSLAARWARETIARALSFGSLEPHAVLNINLPLTEEVDPAEPLPPIRVVPMNLAAVRDRYESRDYPSGQVYYWMRGDGLDFHATTEGSDVDALIGGRHVTITPLQYDLTAHRVMPMWRERFRPES